MFFSDGLCLSHLDLAALRGIFSIQHSERSAAIQLRLCERSAAIQGISRTCLITL
jgi:hypothetical protein